MQTDDDLAELFERAVADLAPDVTAIVHMAEQLGRKLRRRSHLRQAAGSALAVVLVAGAGYATWSAHPLTRASGQQAQAAGGARSAGAGAQPGGTPAGHLTGKQALKFLRQRAAARREAALQRREAELKPMTSQQMIRVLRSLLPTGSVVAHVSTENGPGTLEVNYNDGRGAVDLLLEISTFTKVITSQQLHSSGPPVGATHKPVSWVLALSCPNPLWTDEGTRPAGALPISCLVRTTPGGGVERDAVMYADEYGFYGYNIYDQRPDGVEVFIQVGNGYFDPYLPHVDRATPPGSITFWESVVDSPAWHS
jgi:hypothetical protein